VAHSLLEESRLHSLPLRRPHNFGPVSIPSLDAAAPVGKQAAVEHMGPSTAGTLNSVRVTTDHALSAAQATLDAVVNGMSYTARTRACMTPIGVMLAFVSLSLCLRLAHTARRGFMRYHTFIRLCKPPDSPVSRVAGMAGQEMGPGGRQRRFERRSQSEMV
jgi:hypothetical protein